MSAIKERANWRPKWRIEKYHGEAKKDNLYKVEEFEGNLLLDEGITELLTLLIGGAATAFNNANAYIGVGNSDTAAAADQTGLQGASKTYKGMDDTYPQVSAQTVTFKSTFGGSDGNHAWEEFTVANANSDSGDNLDRKVEDHGVKASPDTWVIQLQVTLS